MSLFKEIQADIVTACEVKKYKKTRDKVIKEMLAMNILIPNPVSGPLVPHPTYAKHLEQVKSNFANYVKNYMKYDNDKTLLFGDSIAAISKDYISDVVDTRLNWALGGMRAGHMLQLLNDMLPIIQASGFIPKYVVVGTPDGNGLLQHYEINIIKQDCIILLNALRAAFPTAKIILYGLPMTVSDYAMKHFVEYDTNLYEWILKDPYSVMLPLIKMFVEPNHIMMKADMNCDGVHPSPKGQVLLGKLIKKAKTTTPVDKLVNCY